MSGVSFSTRGPVPGKKCLQIRTPTKSYYEIWDRSYLCWPHDGIYKFKWLTHAPTAEERANCLEWSEPRDPTWGRNRYFLCATKDRKPIGRFFFKISVTFYSCFFCFPFSFLNRQRKRFGLQQIKALAISMCTCVYVCVRVFAFFPGKYNLSKCCDWKLIRQKGYLALPFVYESKF